MTTDGNIVYRGHVEECLAHLDKNLRQGKRHETAAARREIAQFCGVQVQTIARWVDAKHLPVGDQYFRLLCCLDAAGYDVVEAGKIHPGGMRFAAELIGYSILTGQEIAELVGYKTPTTLYKVLRGAEGASQEKANRIWAIGIDYQDQLKGRKESAKSLLRQHIPRRSPDTLESRIISNIAEALLLLVEDAARNDLTRNEELIKLVVALAPLVPEQKNQEEDA